MIANSFGEIGDRKTSCGWYNSVSMQWVAPPRQLVYTVCAWDKRALDIGNNYAIHTCSSTKATYFGELLEETTTHLTVKCFDGIKQVRKNLITEVWKEV
jgi:hypothetical protein